VARPKRKIQKTSRTFVRVSKDQTDQNSFLERIQSDLENKQSLLSLVLGVLILIVVGVLIFNYINKPKGELGPSQQTNISTTSKEDVSKDSLPGKYVVKQGDTLFTIAKDYYGDGYQYTKVAEDNQLTDPNVLEVGQILNIPKLDLGNQNNSSPSSNATLNAKSEESMGTGGAINQTIWGETITGNTYTIVAGDWLSKIAGRAYGDIYAFDKIAKANNITDPNNIEPGMVLKIPR